MKRFCTVMLALACLLLAGCGPKAEEPRPPEPEEPLRMDALSIEFAPAGGDGETLLSALRRLPDKLKTALAEAGVEVGEVRVTLGTSQDATARAVGQGGVDVAVLTAEGYAQAASGGRAVLADAGETAVLCAGPSAYGRALAGRSSPTWDELDRARWGVLRKESNLGWRYLDLWLADGYGGLTLSDLSQVQVYGSYEDLLRAAAASEIDVFPSTERFLSEVSDAWMVETSRADETGYRGFGREAALAAEVTVLGETAPCRTGLVAVRAEETLENKRFLAALEIALNALAEDEDRAALAGTLPFAPITDDALDPIRRLLTLEG